MQSLEAKGIVFSYKDYAIYHGRNIVPDDLPGDRRTARICKLTVKDGVITAHQYKDHV